MTGLNVDPLSPSVCVQDLPAASHVPHCVSSSSQDQQRNLKTLHKLHTLTDREQVSPH